MQFLSLSYWLNLNPGTLHPPIQKILISFIVLWFAAIFIFKKFEKIKHKDLPRAFWANLASYSINNTIVGFLLIFFSFERVTLLSARFWFLLWLTYIIWYPIHRHKQIAIGKEKRKESTKDDELKKYLPKNG